MIHAHAQNLNERYENGRVVWRGRMLRHGRVFVHFSERHVAHLEWVLGRLGLSVALALFTGDSGTGLSGYLALPGLALYWGIDGVFRGRRKDRRLSLAMHGGGVYWTVWRSEFAEYSRRVPRWRQGSFMLPWSWQHIRHEWLRPDGTVFRAPGEGEYDVPPEVTERHEYSYTLRNGTVQHRVATVNGEEREWRWRWLTWLPWPRRVSRTINVTFDADVGERSGSWKGGCYGCGWDWWPDETMEQALRRMEATRKFS